MNFIVKERLLKLEKIKLQFGVKLVSIVLYGLNNFEKKIERKIFKKQDAYRCKMCGRSFCDLEISPTAD